MIERNSTRDRNDHWTMDTHHRKNKGRPKKIWKLARTLKSKSLKLPNLFAPNEQIVTTNEEKADLIGEFFAEANRPQFATDPDDQLILDNANDIRSGHDIDDNYVPTTTDEIPPVQVTRHRRYSEHLFEEPAGCCSEATVPYLQLLSPHRVLAIIIQVRQSGPNWKVGNPTKASDFKPTSLIDTIAKLYERIMLENVKQQVDEHRVFPDHQFGFRVQYSAPHQAMRLVQHIKSNNRARRSAGVEDF